MNASSSTQAGAPRRSVLWTTALMAVVGVCSAAGSAAVLANETTGRVFGRASPNATVLVGSSQFGIQRRIQADADGRYALGWLPIGVYSVTVVDNGQPLVQHPSVPVFVDRGSRVDFECANGRCSDLAEN